MRRCPVGNEQVRFSTARGGGASGSDLLKTAPAMEIRAVENRTYGGSEDLLVKWLLCALPRVQFRQQPAQIGHVEHVALVAEVAVHHRLALGDQQFQVVTVEQPQRL